ncbi:hypothetical protein AAL_08120 [Moelleriella libera RCEF 2490]|uniref:Uncharacterized protein n=1 Tax=Moelleriella libera RCEF 2490 TaxID=1081109 RepID=A0A167W3I8_9HYPO|nr:hypothetical protein AAL_08120 [Moelleriella libera RCEF 2490]
MPALGAHWSRSVLFAALLLLDAAPFVAAEDALAKFGDKIPILGRMQRTDQDFVDGLALDLFSPVNRTLIVTNNTSPLPGNFVTGSSGEGFVNLSKYSWIIKFNETADDLIAKIELPYDPDALKKQGVDISNTYVGKLAADGKSWVVSESQRNVHILMKNISSENKTRIIKMTSMDGEYMLLGRKSVDTTNIFVQYGQGATRTVNVTEGDKFQEAEFVDGLRFKIRSTKPLAMNVELVDGIDKASLPEYTVALNSFAWVVNSTNPAESSVDVSVRFPYNEKMLAAKAPGRSTGEIIVAKRGLNGETSEKFEEQKDQKLVRAEDRILVSDITQLDGQYVLLKAARRAQGKAPSDSL